MRVLFLTRVFPHPAHAGDLRYSLNLAEALAAHPDLDVTVFCGSGFREPPSESHARWVGANAIPGRGADIRGLVGKFPRGAQRAMPPSAHRALAALLDRERFDVALLNEAVMAPALPLLERHGVPVVYVSHNVDADIRPAIAAQARNPVKRLLLRRDAGKYRRMELDLLKRVRGLTTITPDDRARYKTLAPELPATVVTPGFRAVSQAASLPMEHRRPVAVLLGSFEWNAKIANLEEILDAFERYRADVGQVGFTLRIAGRSRSGLFDKLSRQHQGVDFIENFEHLSDVVADARIGLVLETMGGGFKLKTLDYIFSNLAIVGYPHALAGADLDPGTDYFAVDGPGDAMRRIDDLIGETGRLETTANNARRRAGTAYDWNDRARTVAAFLGRLQI